MRHVHTLRWMRPQQHEGPVMKQQQRKGEGGPCHTHLVHSNALMMMMTSIGHSLRKASNQR